MGNAASTENAEAKFQLFERTLFTVPFLREPSQWKPFWDLSSDENHIWTFFSIDFLAELKQFAPFNLACLICLCLSALANKIYSSHPLYAGRGDVEVSANETDSIPSLDNDKILLIVRVLTRIMTFLHSSDDVADFEHEFMWNFVIPPELVRRSLGYYSKTSIITPDESDDEDENTNAQTRGNTTTKTEQQAQEQQQSESDHEQQQQQQQEKSDEHEYNEQERKKRHSKVEEEEDLNSLEALEVPEEYGSLPIRSEASGESYDSGTETCLDSHSEESDALLTEQIRTSLLSFYQGPGAVTMRRLPPAKQFIHLMICLTSLPGFTSLKRDMETLEALPPVMILVNTKKMSGQSIYPTYQANSFASLSTPISRSSSQRSTLRDQEEGEGTRTDARKSDIFATAPSTPTVARRTTEERRDEISPLSVARDEAIGPQKNSIGEISTPMISFKSDNDIPIDELCLSNTQANATLYSAHGNPRLSSAIGKTRGPSANANASASSLTQATLFPALLWHSGIEPYSPPSPVSYFAPDDMVRARIAVLTCILSAISGIGSQSLLFAQEQAQVASADTALKISQGLIESPVVSLNKLYRSEDEYVTEFTSMRRTLTPTLFYSLLNTVSSHVTLDAFGKLLPYGYSLSPRVDVEERATTLSLAILSRCIDYTSYEDLVATNNPQFFQQQQQRQFQHQQHQSTPTNEKDVSSGRSYSEASTTTISTPVVSHTASSPSASYSLTHPASTQEYVPRPFASHVNVFRALLGSLSSSQSRVFTLNVLEILSNPIEAESTWLPYSTRRVTFTPELFLFLFRCLEAVPRLVLTLTSGSESDLSLESPSSLGIGLGFGTGGAHRSHVETLIRVTLFQLYEARANAKLAHTMYVSMFMLLRCSSERPFCVALNRIYPNDLPLGPLAPIAGETRTYADLLLGILCIVISHSSPTDTLFTISLLILCNISPYITSLQPKPVELLMNVLRDILSARFILSTYNPYQYMTLILEVISSIIQYQYNGNAYFIMDLLKNADIFAIYGSAEMYADAIEKKIAEYETDYRLARESAVRNEKYTISAPLTLYKQTTECLVTSYKRLPILAILQLLKNLKPKADPLFKKAGDSAVVSLVRNNTIVGILPQPHPIVMRKYAPNVSTDNWFASLYWALLQNKTLKQPIIELDDMGGAKGNHGPYGPQVADGIVGADGPRLPRFDDGDETQATVNSVREQHVAAANEPLARAQRVARKLALEGSKAPRGISME